MGADTRAVRVDGVSKVYGDRTVLNEVSFEVGTGRVVGLLGRNGAGKTTLMKTLLGLAAPASGTVEVLGGRPGEADCARIGVAMENLGFYPATTVAKELGIWARALGVSPGRTAELIERVGLSGHERQRCTALSTGQRQRLRLATALLSPSVELLVLDEPTNGLDPDGIRWIRSLVREFAADGGTVLVSSHQLSEMENTVDDVLVLESGRLAYSGPLGEFTEDGARSLEERFFDIAGR